MLMFEIFEPEFSTVPFVMHGSAVISFPSPTPIVISSEPFLFSASANPFSPTKIMMCYASAAAWWAKYIPGTRSAPKRRAQRALRVSSNLRMPDEIASWEIELLLPVVGDIIDDLFGGPDDE